MTKKIIIPIITALIFSSGIYFWQRVEIEELGDRLIRCNNFLTDNAFLEVEMKELENENKRLQEEIDENLTKSINYNNSLQFTNTKYSFSLSYPEKAFLSVCDNTTTNGFPTDKIKPIPLKIYQKENSFKVAYEQQVETINKNCELKQITNYDELEHRGLKFEIYLAETAEKFIHKAYDSKCLIRDEITIDDDLKRILIKRDPEDPWLCEDSAFLYNMYDSNTKKGVVFHRSNADYYIQKYPTYQETMKKGSFDNEILSSFHFDKIPLEKEDFKTLVPFKYE